MSLKVDSPPSPLSLCDEHETTRWSDRVDLGKAAHGTHLAFSFSFFSDRSLSLARCFSSFMHVLRARQSRHAEQPVEFQQAHGADSTAEVSEPGPRFPKDRMQYSCAASSFLVFLNPGLLRARESPLVPLWYGVGLCGEPLGPFVYTSSNLG